MMRPESLFALFSDVNRLAGVGPAVKATLARLLGAADPLSVILRDLVFHLPVGVTDRRNSPPLSQAKEGQLVTLIVTVGAHQRPAGKFSRKIPYKVLCHTAEGMLTLTFFHARHEQIAKLLPEGEQRVVSGHVERYGARVQMTHPDLIVPVSALAEVMKLEPVYGLTAGLSNRQLTKIMRLGLAKLPDLPEWIDRALFTQRGWQHWKPALLSAHAPQEATDILPASIARTRLAYDELLANQLALAIARQGLRKRSGRPIAAGRMLRAKTQAMLPFTLTDGQQKALAEIDADMNSGERMLRLLQGDVGSGKTVVALMTMLSAVEAGAQAALMAPTELLAKQHAAFFERTLGELGIRTVLLTGSLKGKEAERIHAEIASGEAQCIIGTHALFQQKVMFKDLAVAVIDEQHRFGVRQRTMLVEKSPSTHLLVMTATPIPRTLVMAAFGDMDTSILAQKPAGRQPIATKAVPLSREEEVLQGVARTLERGEKVYWVCPLIEESDEETQMPDLAAAQARYVEFTHRFKGRAALAHGRMSQQERDRAMEGFAGSDFDLLVATTVVEVGVDVSDATVMVIEHAERFGLSQLHQLRGRVGRNDKPSACILLYADPCGETAKARMRVLRETNDGFRIAEEDRKLRGGGDVLGTRQSGMPGFHFADMEFHAELLEVAHQDARLALHHDPRLVSERGNALRHLLYLFRHDDNIRLLEAG